MIREATAADLPQIAQVMGAAFETDPVASWFWRRRNRRREHIAGWYRRFAERHYLPRGRVLVAEEEEGEVAGCSMWSPPGGWRVPPGAELRLAGYALPRLGRHVLTATRAMQAIDGRHPKRPHWYLGELGVRPASQGRGLGSRLMFDVLTLCDREEIPAYLVSSTERSRALYERHGFTVQEEMRLPRGGPPLWLMWREPAASAAG